jgi:hypothetical protein
MPKASTALYGMIAAAALTVGGVVSSIVGSSSTAPDTQQPGAQAAAVEVQGGTCTIPVVNGGAGCPSNVPLVVSDEIPSMLKCTSQAGADCVAWQDFIAVNWPASATAGQPDKSAPPSDYGEPGTPGNFQATVWMTYQETSEIFLPGAATPPPWGSSRGEAACELPAPRTEGSSVAMRSVRAVAENFQLIPKLSPDSDLQADGNWLADRYGNLVWYEILVNKTYYDYIVNNELYSSADQWAISVRGKPGVDPPVGSMELKAAWREIPQSLVPQLSSRYLMTDGCIPAPGGGARYATLGLVGLHIVHKLANQSQWLWTTFEQIDNAPDAADPRAAPPSDAGWSFYDPDCKPVTIPSECLDGGPPVTMGCDGEAPPYSVSGYLSGTADACAPRPIQVVRHTPIPGCTNPSNSASCSPARQVNALAQQAIRGANPNSVLQYYQLINVMWWSSSTEDQMKGGVSVNLNTTGSQLVPSGAHMANTVLETYFQDSTCLTCHVGAAVSNEGGGGKCTGGQCASDFSFIFDNADYPDAGADH